MSTVIDMLICLRASRIDRSSNFVEEIFRQNFGEEKVKKALQTQCLFAHVDIAQTRVRPLQI